MTHQNISIDRQPKQSYGAEYENHLFEQYKLYVEMADRVSARRNLANTFFLGVNTTLLTAFTVLLKENILPQSIISCIPFIAAILLCVVWRRMTISYKQLNSGKFKVIHLIEQRLPIALYDSEWELLGKGENPSLYRPLTHVENWVPICFIVLYVLIFVAIWHPLPNVIKNETVEHSKLNSQLTTKLNPKKTTSLTDAKSEDINRVDK